MSGGVWVDQESPPVPFVVSTWVDVPSALGSVQVTFEVTFVGAFSVRVLDASASVKLRVVFTTRFFKVVCNSLQFHGVLHATGIVTAAKTRDQVIKIHPKTKM